MKASLATISDRKCNSCKATCKPSHFRHDPLQRFIHPSTADTRVSRLPRLVGIRGTSITLCMTPQRGPSLHVTSNDQKLHSYRSPYNIHNTGCLAALQRALRSELPTRFIICIPTSNFVELGHRLWGRAWPRRLDLRSRQAPTLATLAARVPLRIRSLLSIFDKSQRFRHLTKQVSDKHIYPSQCTGSSRSVERHDLFCAAPAGNCSASGSGRKNLQNLP